MAEVGLPTFVTGFIAGVLGIAVVLKILPIVSNYTSEAQIEMAEYSGIIGLITLLAVFGGIGFAAKIFLK